MSEFAKRFGMTDHFDREIEVTSPTLTGFAPRRRVGLFYSGIHDEKARAYLERAEAMEDLSALPESERKEFYNRLVGACARTGRDDEAILYQRKSIASSGGSRAALAGLYHKTGQFQKRDETIDLALADTERREDVLQVVHLLVSLKRESEALDGLEAVLASPGIPDDTITFAQRVRLLELYEKHGRGADAVRILNLLDAASAPVDSPYRRLYLYRIEKARERLNASR